MRPGFPGGSVVKNPINAGNVGLTPGLGRFPGEGNGNPRQYFCPTDRGAWWAIVLRVTKVLDMIVTKQQQQT